MSTAVPTRSTTIVPMDSPHYAYLRKCLSLAVQSPPRDTNFRVGAVLVSRDEHDSEMAGDRILSTGYTMELSGNTHAEQCCLSNYASVCSVPDERVSEVLPSEPNRRLVMYVTMEPCGKRLSGNMPCAQRIAETHKSDGRGIQKVYFGVKEPGTFIGESEGCKMLSAAGVEWELLPGMEKKILEIATAGHKNKGLEIISSDLEETQTNITDISPEERERQARLPRNPKKRVMEGEISPFG